jgi:hypothetical protein
VVTSQLPEVNVPLKIYEPLVMLTEPPAPKFRVLADVVKLGKVILTKPVALEVGPQLVLHQVIPVTKVLIVTELDVTAMPPPLRLKSTLLARAAVGRPKANNANKTTRLILLLRKL